MPDITWSVSTSQVAHESGNTRVVVLNAGEEIEGSMETPELRSGKMHEAAAGEEEYETGDMVSGRRGFGGGNLGGA